MFKDVQNVICKGENSERLWKTKYMKRRRGDPWWERSTHAVHGCIENVWQTVWGLHSLSLFFSFFPVYLAHSQTHRKDQIKREILPKGQKKYFVQRVYNTLDVFYVVIIIFSKLRIRVQLSWRWLDEMGPRFNSSLSSLLSAVTEEAKALLQRLGGESWKTATGFLDSAFSTKGWRVLFKEMVMHKI